jgi:cell division protein FtsW
MMFAIAAVLAVFGTMMVYSASAMLAHRETAGASQFTYFYKQAGFTVAGVVLMLLISRFDYRRLNNIYAVGVILLVTIAALAAVYMFPEINGAQRWIRFGGLSLQPSEMAKIALPLFLAYFLTRNETRVGEIKATVLPCLAVLGVVGGLVFFEAGPGYDARPWGYFCEHLFRGRGKAHTRCCGRGANGRRSGGSHLITAPWRMRSLAAFVDPCNPENSADAGYQVCQSLYAIGSGGIVGEGFAKGQQKLFYLPVSAFGFYLFGGRRGIRADRDAERGNAFCTAVVARGEGRG